jgi:hypothetical protein
MTCIHLLLVVKEHDKFTQDNATTTSMTITVKLKKYDRENNKAAVAWRRALLSWYLNVLNWVITLPLFNSVYCHQMLQLYQSHLPRMQDLSLLWTGCPKPNKYAKELLAASECKHILTLVMLKAFFKAGGTGNGADD